jgi:hypothetical protein
MGELLVDVGEFCIFLNDLLALTGWTPVELGGLFGTGHRFRQFPLVVLQAYFGVCFLTAMRQAWSNNSNLI